MPRDAHGGKVSPGYDRQGQLLLRELRFFSRGIFGRSCSQSIVTLLCRLPNSVASPNAKTALMAHCHGIGGRLIVI